MDALPFEAPLITCLIILYVNANTIKPPIAGKSAVKLVKNASVDIMLVKAVTNSAI